jgi:hypothetical protein
MVKFQGRYVRIMNGNTWQEEQSSSMILCLVDFSESSNRALQWAVQMADILHAPITVLHVFRLLQSKSGEALLMKKAKEADANSHFVELERSLLLNKKINYDFKTLLMTTPVKMHFVF